MVRTKEYCNSSLSDRLIDAYKHIKRVPYMTSVILLQTRSIIETGYKVECSITSSSGIVTTLFVKRESTYEFDHVATLNDLLVLPNTPDPRAGYFLDDACEVTFVDVSAAQGFADGVKARIDNLLDLYDVAANDFIGAESTIISTP